MHNKKCSEITFTEVEEKVSIYLNRYGKGA